MKCLWCLNWTKVQQKLKKTITEKKEKINLHQVLNPSLCWEPTSRHQSSSVVKRPRGCLTESLQVTNHSSAVPLQPAPTSWYIFLTKYRRKSNSKSGKHQTARTLPWESVPEWGYVCEVAPAASCDLQLFDGWPSLASEAEPVKSCGVWTDARSVLSDHPSELILWWLSIPTGAPQTATANS